MSVLKFDDREKDADLIEQVIYTVQEAGHDIEMCRLTVGDFVWDDQICIEHKSVDDFVNSVTRGTLDEQLIAMQQYPHRFLFIDGNWTRVFTRKGSMTVRQKDAKILSILARDKIPVYHVPDAGRMATALLQVRRFIQDKGERVEVVQRYSHVTNRGNPTLDSYAKLPYLGPKRIERILAEYPSFYEFLIYYRSLTPNQRVEEFRWLDRRTREYLDAL